MTEQEMDELLSAVLDGEASASDVERVTGDAELQPQLEALRAVRNSLTVPPPVDGTVRESMISAAMAEFARLNQPTVDVEPPVSLGATRSAKASRGRSLNRLAAVAASVAVVVGVGVAVSSQNSQDDTSSATAAIADERSSNDATEAGKDADSVGGALASGDSDSDTMMSAEAAEAPAEMLDTAEEGSSSATPLEAEQEAPDDTQTADEEAVAEESEQGPEAVVDERVATLFERCRKLVADQLSPGDVVDLSGVDLSGIDLNATNPDGTLATPIVIAIVSRSGEVIDLNLDLGSCIISSQTPQP
jgi:negative regulator of sigma E activity